jgi:hypothetical protein
MEDFMAGATEFDTLLPDDDPIEKFLASLPSAFLEPTGLQGHTTAAAEFEEAATWRPPRPIVSELCPVEQLSAALLPKRLADFVFDEANRMPCPPDYIAAACIVALGSLIGARCAVKPKRMDDGWLVVPNLWGGIIGDPSTKKTPAISVVVKELDRLEADEANKVAEKMVFHSAEKAAYEACKKAIEKEMRDAASADCDVDEKERRLASAKRNLATLTAPEEPCYRRFKANDATTEKLGDLLTTNPAGLLVIRDELTGLLSSWDKTGHEGDRAFYLESWNGTQSFNIDRIGRGSQFVPHLCLSVFGGIQPDLLLQYLTGIVHSLDNDGRIQRFQVLVYPDAVPWAWRDQLPSRETRMAMRTIFNHLASFDPTLDGAQHPNEFVALPYFTFNDAAQQLFVEWSEDLYRRMKQETNLLIRQHLAKFEKLFCSLALIFHLVDGRVGSIQEDTALQAAAYCAYLASHARRIYGMVDVAGVTAAQVLSRRIADGKLENHFTARDVLRKGWGGLATMKQVDNALGILEEAGWVKAVEHSGGTGRPTTAYLINPQVTNKTDERNHS